MFLEDRLDIRKRKNQHIYLDEKINDYINWYRDNVDDEGVEDLKKIIEKTAIWYELRYPDYELIDNESLSVNDVMFKNNKYLNNIFSDDSSSKIPTTSNINLDDVEWSKFYNFEVFFNSLPLKEKSFFYKPGYPSLLYLNSNFHVHVESDGTIYGGFTLMDKNRNILIDSKEIEGLNLKDMMKLLKERNIQFPKDNEVEKAIKNYDKREKTREGFLDCIMYRIIERGDERIGPRRALLFAKEFERNIDIPIIYGIDLSDPYLNQFIEDYLSCRGNKRLECINDYFYRKSNNLKMEKILLEDVIDLQKSKQKKLGEYHG